MRMNVFTASSLAVGFFWKFQEIRVEKRFFGYPTNESHYNAVDRIVASDLVAYLETPS